jgi:hypothetical protein
MRCTGLGQLDYGSQNAEHGAKRRIPRLAEPADPVEMAEQLVRAIDEVNDQFDSIHASLPENTTWNHHPTPDRHPLLASAERLIRFDA